MIAFSSVTERRSAAARLALANLFMNEGSGTGRFLLPRRSPSNASKGFPRSPNVGLCIRLKSSVMKAKTCMSCPSLFMLRSYQRYDWSMPYPPCPRFTDSIPPSTDSSSLHQAWSLSTPKPIVNESPEQTRRALSSGTPGLKSLSLRKPIELVLKNLPGPYMPLTATLGRPTQPISSSNCVCRRLRGRSPDSALSVTRMTLVEPSTSRNRVTVRRRVTRTLTENLPGRTFSTHRCPHLEVRLYPHATPADLLPSEPTIHRFLFQKSSIVRWRWMRAGVSVKPCLRMG